jgi:uncharacterized protein YjiS (DUF1127 family)
VTVPRPADGPKLPDAALRRYEISFDGDVRGLVDQIRPSARILGVPTRTILWRHTRSAAELDTILHALLDLGITPREIHESMPVRTEPVTYCEVRVDGRLGLATLHHLRWSYRVASTTIVQLQTDRDGLQGIFTELAGRVRIDYVLSR